MVRHALYLQIGCCHQLRPEAVESFFVLHELTGDPKYREWGHEVFQAFQKYSFTKHGYGSFADVTDAQAECCTGEYDKQPTFWAAETLKYLYLLQDPDHQISLDKYVFNTEGHPFPLQDKMPSGFYTVSPRNSTMVNDAISELNAIRMGKSSNGIDTLSSRPKDATSVHTPLREHGNPQNERIWNFWIPSSMKRIFTDVTEAIR
eukprot:gnl/MRDRNA2_/MRDRNA2_28025_c0_seq1.p1 gnl/MRDRNA2_/MRDRNA2_28025_c0~~gnl/MRDRNA2_/MRDRNA2_28025_c0_seq1.p1  ORF type:complete len:204 (+),score=21.68 gnl/MRDRNA2_/MRDRNA2_28025_c0_seq1:32-643(+)